MQSTKDFYKDLKEEQYIRIRIISEFEALQAAVERLKYENKQLRRKQEIQKSELSRVYDALLFFESVRDNMDSDLLEKYDRIGDSVLIQMKGGKNEI